MGEALLLRCVKAPWSYLDANSLTFYAVGEDGVLKTFQLNGENVWTNSNSSSNLVVGSESTGSVFNDSGTGITHTGYGNGNNRKTFNGTMDYLAMFDSALSEAEVLNIFATPEPSRTLCLALGVGALLLRRRR